MSRILILMIRGYQWVISPWLAPRCRFLPTCSEYAIEALRRHGLLRGLVLSVRRIGRCHPWGGSGVDEVPGVNRPRGRDVCRHS
ncbi:MAG: membrane protein insertion efficiency factor YidD [Burkholderiaceae bacterium]